MSKGLAGFTRGKWVLGSRGVKRRNDDRSGKNTRIPKTIKLVVSLHAFSSSILWPEFNSNQNLKVTISSERPPGPQFWLWSWKGNSEISRECGNSQVLFLLVYFLSSGISCPAPKQ